MFVFVGEKLWKQTVEIQTPELGVLIIAVYAKKKTPDSFEVILGW